MYTRLWVVALLPAAVACDGIGGPCTTSVEPGIIVVVEDSSTGIALADGARGEVREGTFADSLRPHSYSGQTLISLAGADERPGHYTVTVKRSGYLRWERTGIRVGEGGCHVNTRTITARLQPEP